MNEVSRVAEPATASAHAGRRSGDRGSASVLVALWAVVLAVLATAGIVLSSVLAVRETAATAADLGALAGASGVLGAEDEPCRRAKTIVRTNGADLVDCRVVGAQVWVEVRAPAPAAVAWLLPGRGGTLRARGHAELVPRDA